MFLLAVQTIALRSRKPLLPPEPVGRHHLQRNSSDAKEQLHLARQRHQQGTCNAQRRNSARSEGRRLEALQGCRHQEDRRRRRRRLWRLRPRHASGFRRQCARRHLVPFEQARTLHLLDAHLAPQHECSLLCLQRWRRSIGAKALAKRQLPHFRQRLTRIARRLIGRDQGLESPGGCRRSNELRRLLEPRRKLSRCIVDCRQCCIFQKRQPEQEAQR